MNLRRIKHMMLRLSPEEKLAAGGALAVILSSFLPWYSVVNNVTEQNLTYNGFSGDIGVMGFVVFLLTGINLAVLLGEHLHIKVPTFGFKKEKASLFLSAESAFLLLLMLGVYTKRSLDFTNADIRFGLYTALAGAVIGTFALFAQSQKNERKEAREFFGYEEHEEEVTDETEMSAEPESAEEVADDEPEQKGFFYNEETAAQPQMVSEHSAEEMFEVSESPEPYQPAHTADETAVETQHAAYGEDASQEVVEEISNAPSQSDFFKRDAGIKVENIRQVDQEDNKEVKKQTAGGGSDFYEDL